MKNKRFKSVGLAGGAAIGVVASVLLPPTGSLTAYAADQYELIPQKQLKAVYTNSTEPAEPGGGKIELALDGNDQTYWHTAWNPTSVPPPHSFIIKLADSPIDNIGRVVLTPRQSSNGSGRAADLEVLSLSGKECTAENKDAAEWTKVAEKSIPAQYGADNVTKPEAKLPVAVDFTAPVKTNCLKVVYKSTWGGMKVGDGHEKVASLAEFNVYKQIKAGPIKPVTEPTVAGALTLTDGKLSVTADPNFPRPLAYTLDGKKLLGNIRDLNATDGTKPGFVINGQAVKTTIAPAQKAGESSASWAVSTESGQTFTVKMTVKDGALEWRITDIKDSEKAPINTINVANLDIITLDGADSKAQVSSAGVSVNRANNADRFTLVSEGNGEQQSRWLVANNSDLAASVASNAIIDNTVENAKENPNHFVAKYQADSAKSTKIATVNTVGWVHRSAVSASKSGERDSRVYPAAGSGAPQDGIGPDPDPFLKVVVTGDANHDSQIDWQDGAIAYRSIMTSINGGDRTKNLVVPYIPFNIVSQATNPFLKTLDDIKRISLGTDNLGQRALLKGYQAEGHDSAQGDYSGHYNYRAGGFDDLVKLANGARQYNTLLGVHVNVTESYSEAYAFNETLLKMPPRIAWGWMNQAYYMDAHKDLGSGNVVSRFLKFKQDLEKAGIKDVLNWLYFDVYYPQGGWQPQRLASEMKDQGWIISSEWAYALLDGNTWSHWTNEERYGGTTMKGINSQIARFMENSYRDIWNPDPLLDYSQMVDFTGWGGYTDYNATYQNIWKRNLPTKFLQQGNIIKWVDGHLELDNGTTVDGPKQLQGNPTDLRTGRTINYDGATVLNPDGSYLLPWKDGGQDRLYHWNPNGGSKTFTLTKSWQSQSSLKLFELTDQGRKEIANLPVSGGKVTLPASIEANKAYVLYPTSQVPAAPQVTWGEGTGFADPGFNSADISKYQTTGSVKVIKTARANYQAELGAGEASLAQTLDLPAGTYSAWAWVQVEPNKQRQVEVSVSGQGAKVSAGKYQKAISGIPTSTITDSTAMNATASDPLVYKKQDPSYFQRVPVEFTTTGGTVVFKVTAKAGDALVRLDNLRVVKHKEAVDKAPTDKTVFFTDFEDVDTGYFPFVTGSTNVGGDARTQLAERHEPYSQAGWYGVEPGQGMGEATTKGAKVVDNVLDGTWSLLAHEENSGQILRTHSGSLPFTSGHKYRVTMDYQTRYDDGYYLGVNYDHISKNGVSTSEIIRTPFASTVDKGTKRQTVEFTAGGCGTYYLTVVKDAGARAQDDLAIDNLRVEDLGVDPAGVACAAAKLIPNQSPVSEGDKFELIGTVTNNHSGDMTNVVYEITGPDGFTYEVKTAGPTSIKPNETGTVKWTTTMPAGVQPPKFTMTVKYQADGAAQTVKAEAQVGVVKALYKGVNHLADLPFTEVENGWGPIERDQENGEDGARDGGVMSLNGKEYPRGLGAHAKSQAVFNLAGKCQRLKGVIGLDDSQPRGNFALSVLDDSGQAIYGPTTFNSTHMNEVLDIDITGAKQITLFADPLGSAGNDHVDWADIRVICTEGLQPAEIKLALTPAETAAGSDVTATLTNLQPLEPVTLEIPGGNPATLTGVADTFGNLTLKFKAPNKPGETVEVVAKQTVAGLNLQAKAPLKITGDSGKPDTAETGTQTDPVKPGVDSGSQTDPVKPKPGVDSGSQTDPAKPKPGVDSGSQTDPIKPNPNPNPNPDPKPNPNPNPDPQPKPQPGAEDPFIWYVLSDGWGLPRFSGIDRVETSLRSWQVLNSNTMILVGSLAEPDALAVSPLAKLLHTGVVFTPAQKLHPQVAKALTDRKISEVIVAGGSGSVSDAVLAELQKLGIKVTRVAGADRFETAALVAQDVAHRQGKEVKDLPTVLANGLNFADSLSAGALAAKQNGVLLFTQNGSLPAPTVKLLESGYPQLTSVGGLATQAAKASQLTRGHLNAGIVGQDRYETSALVAKQFFPAKSKMALVSGEIAADAVVASAWIANYEGGVLLTRKNAVPDSIRQVIASQDYRLAVIGGYSQVNFSNLK